MRISELPLDVLEEFYREDPVYRDIIHVYFLSSSKGRNRKRKHCVEVSLLSYRNNGFKSWHNFPFDKVATECLGNSVKPEYAESELIKRIEDMRRFSCV